MRHGLLAVLGIGLLCGVLGCGGDDDEDDGGSGGGGGSGGSGNGTEKLYCLVTDGDQVIGCDEHLIPSAAIDAARDACETDDNGSVVDICPSAGLIGKCSYVSGALIFWQYEPDDPADAEMECTDTGGTWTAA